MWHKCFANGCLTNFLIDSPPIESSRPVRQSHYPENEVENMTGQKPCAPLLVFRNIATKFGDFDDRLDIN